MIFLFPKLNILKHKYKKIVKVLVVSRHIPPKILNINLLALQCSQEDLIFGNNKYKISPKLQT